MPATCGHTSCKRFCAYDPESSCWRTSSDTSPSDSTLYSDRWPRRGSMRSGVCCTPTKWVPRIDVAACSSLLPTPNASMANYQEEPETWFARKQKWIELRNIRAGMPLPIAVKTLLLTPTTSDQKGSVPPRSERPKGVGKLTEQMRLLPTPRARFGTSGPDMRERPNGKDLFHVIEKTALLPTPISTDHKGGRNATRTETANLTKINLGVTLTDAAWMATGLAQTPASRTGASTTPLSASGSSCSDEAPPPP